jgi:hypothetical protein
MARDRAALEDSEASESRPLLETQEGHRRTPEETPPAPPAPAASQPKANPPRSPDGLMYLAMRRAKQPMRTAMGDGSDPRWNPAWDGRPNFKGFRRSDRRAKPRTFIGLVEHVREVV